MKQNITDLGIPVETELRGIGIRTKLSVQSVVADWQSYLPKLQPLPHPSWRNNAWLRKNTWFETEVVPVIRQNVQEALL